MPNFTGQYWTWVRYWNLPYRIVHEQTYSYFVQNGLLHPDHHGFIQHHFTETPALHQLVDLWQRAANEGKLSATLMLDLKAGFDIINHSILIQKLNKYGFDSLSWFRCYFHEIYQRVQIESSFSGFLLIPWGVPQGSILRPLLFIIVPSACAALSCRHKRKEEVIHRYSICE